MARGRRDGRTIVIVPEVKDGHHDGHHPAARAVPRSAAGHRGPQRDAGLPRPVYAALRDAVTETEPAFREDAARATSRWSTSCARRSSRWPTAGGRDLVIVGVGVDECEVDRMRDGA